MGYFQSKLLFILILSSSLSLARVSNNRIEFLFYIQPMNESSHATILSTPQQGIAPIFSAFHSIHTKNVI